MPQIPLRRIKLDQRAQPRAALDTAITTEYAEAMKAGATFPPLTVFHNGGAYWLADGFHRHYAATQASLRDFPCTVIKGGIRDAILHSCKANAAHGLRRSEEDKRRAVRTLLADEEWGGWSDREIARQCAVSHTFVARFRDEIAPSLTGNVASEKRTYQTKHGTVATMETARIGHRDEASPPLSEGADRKKFSSSRSRTLASTEEHQAPAHYAAFTILAQSLRDMKATPQEIVACDGEERGDLREACEGAIVRIQAVLELLKVRAAAA